MKATIESTKELISTKKPQTDVQLVLNLSIANGKPNILGLTSSILKKDGSVKLAKSVQTMEMHIGKFFPVNMMNTRVHSSLIR